MTPMRGLIAGLCLLAMAGLLLSCAPLQPTVTPTGSLPTATPSPSTTPSPRPTPPPAPSATPDPSAPVWQGFAPPSLPLVTAIPAPLTGLPLNDEVHILALLGTDRTAPFQGRSDAMLLFLYNPRLGNASLISLPPDLMVYLPGHSMQRLNTAYALGGAALLQDTLAYNFGLRPQQWAVVSMDSFAQFVDDLGGLELTLLETLPNDCSGYRVGQTVRLSGDETLCYVRLRQGSNQAARDARQQQVFRLLFLSVIQGGNLNRLPEFYRLYRNVVQTNLSFEELLSFAPLTLRLGDASHFAYFSLAEADMVREWHIEGPVPTTVLLPNRPLMQHRLQQAIEFVLTPKPFSERVLTLEAEWTTSPTPTITRTITPTPSITPTLPPTETPTANTPTPSATGPTPTGTLTTTPSAYP